MDSVSLNKNIVLFVLLLFVSLYSFSDCIVFVLCLFFNCCWQMTYEGLWSQITIQIILHFYYQIKKIYIYENYENGRRTWNSICIYIQWEKYHLNINMLSTSTSMWVRIPMREEQKYKNVKMSTKTTNCKTVVLNVQTFVKKKKKKKKNTAR